MPWASTIPIIAPVVGVPVVGARRLRASCGREIADTRGCWLRRRTMGPNSCGCPACNELEDFLRLLPDMLPARSDISDVATYESRREWLRFLCVQSAVVHRA